MRILALLVALINIGCGDSKSSPEATGAPPALTDDKAEQQRASPGKDECDDIASHGMKLVKADYSRFAEERGEDFADTVAELEVQAQGMVTKIGEICESHQLSKEERDCLRNAPDSQAFLKCY